MGRFTYNLLYLLAILTFISGCLRQEEDPPTTARMSGYMGCSSATLRADGVSIQVSVVIPDKSSEVQIYRNDSYLGSIPSTDSSNTFIDSNIPTLGDMYRYSCKAVISGEGVYGYNQPTVQTDAIDSPSFLGLDSVTIQNKVEAKLQWKVPDVKGSKATKYKIFANLETGSHVDFSQPPIATISAPALNYTISTGNLGDNLNYSFAVLACTSNDLCSGGTVYKTATTLDNGAPQTTGVSSWKGIAGGLEFLVPWNHKMGEIRKRYIYVNKPTNTFGGTDWANQYVQLKAIDINSSVLYNPSLWTNFTDVKIVDSRIIEKSTQHFIIRDVDTQGNQSQLYYLKIENTGDLSAPVFQGYSAVAINTGNEDTQAKITFTAIDREGSSDPGQATGAAFYKVYFTSETYVNVNTANPNDPCKFGAAYNQQFSSSTYPPGTQADLIISNLTPRTLYRFCLKAVDTAGNESADQASSDLLTIATWDKTAPSFDGIQSLTGETVNEEYKLKVEYNPASDASSNVSYYRIKTWISTADYTSSPRKATINRNVSDGWIDFAYITNNTDLKYDDNVLVKVLVDACDDAHTIPGMSSDNCTSLAESTAMSITPPDIVPPQLFLGIESSGWFGSSGSLPSSSSSVNGQVIVKFRKPTLFDTHVTAEDLALYQDYAGFKVYSLDTSNVPTLLKNCPCATPGACNTTTDLQCTVDNLIPDKIYKFYARAYDAAGNVTKYVDPVTKNGSQKVFDGIAPSFFAGVSLSLNTAIVGQPRVYLTWNNATDNQDPSSYITYEVFRKKTSWSAVEKLNPTTVSNSLRGTATTNSYYDSDTAAEKTAGSGIEGGGNFYYLVCAKDAQNNRTCDNIDKNIYITDAVAPKISSISSDKTNDTLNTYKKWYIKFLVDENESTFSRMSIYVRSKYSSGGPSTASISDPIDPNSNNITFVATDGGINKKGYITINNLVGSSGQSGYMNYYIEVSDESGMSSSFIFTVQFDNTLTFTSIANTSGSISGGNLAVIKGSGFSTSTNNNTISNTTVTIGGNLCTSVNILTTGILTCIVPPSLSGGSVTVTITNPDGTIQSSSNAATSYTYTDGASYPFAGCDKTGYRANTTSIPFDSGSYLVCNKDQLLLMGTDSYRTLGANFKLGDNLDLSVGVSFSPIGTNAKPFSGTFDGDGHMLSSLSYTSSTSSPNGVGLFGNVTSSFQFKNTVLINFSIINTASNTSGVYIGTILGKTDGETLVKISDVSVFNSVVSTTDISDPYYSSGAGVGGIFGYIGQGSTSTTGSIFSNITVSGTTVTAKLGGFYSSQIWSNNLYQYDGTGMIGGSMLYNSSSTSFESFTNITINNSTLNCRAACGGVLGRAFKADFNNIQVSALKINTFSGANFYSNYLGANGVGLVAGKIGYFNSINGSWGVSTAKDITVNGEIKTTNTLPSNAVVDLDSCIGGVFGLIVPYTDAVFKNINATFTLDNVASSGNSAHMAPLSYVGGIIGLSVIYNRSDANGIVEFNNIITTSSNIQCDNSCGGIVGGIILPGDSTDKSAYLKTYKFVKNKVDSIFNFNGTTTAVTNGSTIGGHGGIIGRIANKGTSNKLLITIDQIASRGIFNDIDAADFGGGAIGVYDNYAGSMWASVYYPVDYETIIISNSFFATNLKLSAAVGANTGGIFGYYAMSYFDTNFWTYNILSSKTKITNTYVRNTTKYNLSSTKGATTINGGSGISAVPVTTFCDSSKNSNNFVDTDSTMNTNYYITSASCSGFTSKNTSEMKDSVANIYQSAGWDFTTIWKWPAAGNNDGYPVLQWMGE